LEVELVLARLLDRHREHVPARLRVARDAGPVLRVDEHARALLRRAGRDRLLEALPDQGLRIGHPRRVADHLLERAPVVEREDVELRVVAEILDPEMRHVYSLPVNWVSFSNLWRASMRRTVPDRERMTIESVTAPSRT